MPTSETASVHAAKPTTVVAVDDHHAIRSALCTLLNGLPDVAVVGEGTSVLQACQVIEAHDPDVVLLDLCLHGEDGLEVARALRDRDARTKILMLSASDGLDDLRAALDAGADGFLSKSAPMPELVDGIRRTAAGQQVISSELVYALSKPRRGASGVQSPVFAAPSQGAAAVLNIGPIPDLQPDCRSGRTAVRPPCSRSAHHHPP